VGACRSDRIVVIVTEMVEEVHLDAVTEGSAR
jgi:hypothetical protein